MARQPFDVEPAYAPLAANGNDGMSLLFSRNIFTIFPTSHRAFQNMGVHDEESRLDYSMRAISYEQLLDFERRASNYYWWKYGSKTMRDINKDIIAPYCEATGQPCTRLLNPDGLRVGAFVTHSWDEPFEDFVHSIKSVFSSWTHKPNLWICSFALTQRHGNLQGEIGVLPIPQSPFVQALRESEWFVVVRNANTDLYSRLWCVCELWYAQQFGLTEDNKTKITGTDDFSHLPTSCVDAKAFDRNDRAKILSVLLGRPEAAFAGDDDRIHDLSDEEKRRIQEIDALIQFYRDMPGPPPLPPKRRKTQGPWMLTSAAIIFLLLLGSSLWLHLMSPQKKAHAWLAKYPNLDGVGDAHQEQLVALATLYYSGRSSKWATAMPNWLATLYYKYSGRSQEWETLMPNWLDYSIDVCNWLPPSVGECDENGFYTWIHLPSVYAGTIPTEIGMLTSLKSLVFWECTHLTGSIPTEIGFLSHLEYLQIARNGLLSGSMPSELGKLSNLTYLDLAKNSLVGSIPPELQHLGQLEKLFLDGNKLGGHIPSQIGRLSSLKELNFGGDWIGSKNQITGSIPTEVGRLSDLSVMNMEANRLTGQIPSQLGMLTNLKTVNLYKNSLSGTIPSELALLSNLSWLAVYDNPILNCTVPFHLNLGC